MRQLLCLVYQTRLMNEWICSTEFKRHFNYEYNLVKYAQIKCGSSRVTLLPHVHGLRFVYPMVNTQQLTDLHTKQLNIKTNEEVEF